MEERYGEKTEEKIQQAIPALAEIIIESYLLALSKKYDQHSKNTS